MNRISYTSGIGSITYAVIFNRFDFPNALGIKREKGLELDMTKIIKLLRTIYGSPMIGHLWAVGSILLDGTYRHYYE